MLGEATSEEQQQVAAWLAADENNLAYYTQFKNLWDASKQLAAASTVDTEAAWQRLQKRIADKEPTRKSAEKVDFLWMKIAASVIILLGFGWLGYIFLLKEKPGKEILVQTQFNVLNDTLPDGSVITLNKNSSIAYHSELKGTTRNVSLKGEAFFNVTADKKKPFVITVNDVQVTVVGTSFNIKTINGATEVVVETGIVRVTKNGKTIELKANEKVAIPPKDSALNKEEVKDKLYNYYRTKEFICDDTPLWKLVEVVNEAYNAHIVIGRNELRDLRMNTTFYNESLDQVLNVISLTFSLKVVKNGDTIILQ